MPGIWGSLVGVGAGVVVVEVVVGRVDVEVVVGRVDVVVVVDRVVVIIVVVLLVVGTGSGSSVTSPRTQYGWPATRLGQLTPGLSALNWSTERPKPAPMLSHVSPAPAASSNQQSTPRRAILAMLMAEASPEPDSSPAAVRCWRLKSILIGNESGYR